MIAQGPPGQLETDPHSIIGPFLAGAAAVTRDGPARPGPGGRIILEIRDLYNLHDVTAAFPEHRLTALAGPSGAGKTALVLDSLIPAARPVSEVGLGYLRLGEPTPSLSGGESQRLRIASRLRSSQRGALYVFDEPSTGLHPLDVATLAGVFDRLLEAGATIIVIDHDLDLLAAADHLIDMGPGGGPDGGHILAAGIPEDVARDPDSATGPWLAEHLGLPEARHPDVLPGRRASASYAAVRAFATKPGLPPARCEGVTRSWLFPGR